MDPLQRSYSRRSLLPVEQQIIDALGLTVEEYWEFCRLADCKAKERGNEYALVPEVVATGEPNSTMFLINLGVSLLFTAASMLLAPKPPSFDEGPGAIRTADIRGQTKFAELFGFDSLQDLATLGSILPLIFAKRSTLPYDIDPTTNPEDPEVSQTVVGGVRAKGLLIWSQLLSKASHQELKMLTTRGLAELGATPDARGLAVGDQLLRNYQDSRYAAYFRDNFETKGRIIETTHSIASAGSLDADEFIGNVHKGTDVFKAFYRGTGDYEELICGTRTPNSQRSFGCHTPISNGAAFYLDYELVQIFEREKSLQELIDDFLNRRPVLAEGNAGIKELKLNIAYAGRQYAEAFVDTDGSVISEISVLDASNAAINIEMAKGQSVIYRNSHDREGAGEFAPHGTSDINTAIDQRMVDADTNINVGDLYLFGTALVQCVNIGHNRPLEPGTTESNTYQFECKEPGKATLINGNYGASQKEFKDAYTEFFGNNARGNPSYGHHIQKVSIATITNNRACDQTEIGIKSVVFKKINGFANVPSQPSDAVLAEFEDDEQPFQLGRVTTFQTRYSFFRVECREINAANDGKFHDISNKQVFAVKGNSSQPQYNTLRISHPKRMQYEFRIMPVPGSDIVDRFIGLTDNDSNPVQLLGRGDLRTVDSRQTSLGNFQISYTGKEERLTVDKVSNAEFKFSGTDGVEIITSGIVEAFTATANGPVPMEVSFDFLGTRLVYDEDARELKYGVLINVPDPNNNDLAYVRWDGDPVELGEIYRIGAFSGKTVEGKQEWVREEIRFNRTDPSTANHNYVQFDGSRVSLAIWEGVDVTNQLEQPNDVDTTKLYRAPESVSEAEQAVVTPATEERVVEDNPGSNGELYIGNLYYVIIKNPGTAQEQYVAVWNGVDVSAEINQVVSPSNPISYRAGAAAYFDTNLNTTVYRIYRIRYVAPVIGYFGKIEKGQYVGDLIDRKLYYIEKYKRIETLPDFDVLPANYNVVGGSGTGLQISASSFGVGQWQWEIVNGGSGYKVGEAVSVNFTNSDSTVTSVTLYVGNTSEVTRIQPGKEPLNILDAVADYPKYQAEQTSHQDGPEHEIAFVNEQIKPDKVAEYDDLSLLGLRVLAGKDWTSMGQLSAYIKQGIKVERLIDDNGEEVGPGALRASTNNFAEIAYNLLTDARIGAGKRVPSATVDRDAMTIAAQFCRANGFTFDGILEDRQALRDFISTNAAFNLLDFTIIGGRFALKPSVPYNETTYVIDRNRNINDEIKALFTDGNMKDMQVSFMPPQDRQLFKAAVAYREEVDNGFSEQKTVRIRFADTAPYKSPDSARNDSFKFIKGSDTDPEEFLDLTSFCTNRNHASTIAKYKLRVRAHTDHTISFKTTPSSALALQAGDYIKVVSDRTHTSRFNNGSVDASGGITSTTTLNDGPHDVFFWTPGGTDTRMQEGTMNVSDGKTGDPVFFKSIFTTVQTDRQARVYRVDSLTIDDEGYVDIVGTHQELTSSGTLATLVDRAFTVDGQNLEQFEISED